MFTRSVSMISADRPSVTRVIRQTQTDRKGLRSSSVKSWSKTEDKTETWSKMRQTTEHVLSSCRVALSQGRYTWRHNRVLQELASVMSTAKEQFNPTSPSFTIFTTEGGTKTWCGRSNTAITQRKRLLGGCDDWEVLAGLPEWDKHPDVIRRTTLRPVIVIHSPSTQQFTVVEMTAPLKQNGTSPYLQKGKIPGLD
ncbi:reverse transcriptase [Elysia marginata]|uniref:Reverse transcriptase n=1 Tax=Elysia marginata TaxID=1093978 RepID=A0AAV4HVJ6_9GAST|nr:reverse transcriptase [Elysia marginata]